ncbi:hypothetical protein BB560_003308 [Smittium megazygosporum]|uniref:Uncharacterized protein n=1 Tax=Smittium megazygosporum TaxID=133381 RepID=A0A2T9ZCB6_9FUNG|nr:hypothetical protein BB560_003308 [Smittium megazygosporum]
MSGVSFVPVIIGSICATSMAHSKTLMFDDFLEVLDKVIDGSINESNVDKLSLYRFIYTKSVQERLLTICLKNSESTMVEYLDRKNKKLLKKHQEGYHYLL